jgi:hypothetical protein
MAKAAALTIVMFLLMANRPVPKWQWAGNGSLPAMDRCVRAQLEPFGRVRAEHGRKAEAGQTRFFLQQGSREVAAVYLDGEREHSFGWMDAPNHKLGAEIWRSIKLRCHLS